MVTRYTSKLTEISKARNSSDTASKTRGIKWTKAQLIKIAKIASLENSPTIDTIKLFYPGLSEYKANSMLLKVKNKRKELALAVGQFDTIDGIRNSNGKGYVYIIENELYTGWVKIGMTTNLVTRLNSYNCNDPLHRFKVVTSKQVTDRRQIETDLKYKFQLSSTLSRGEWFRIERQVALDIFNTTS